MKPFRIWPPILLIALIFVLRVTPHLIENEPNWVRMAGVLGPLFCCLAILIWWLAGSRASWREKLFGLGGVVLASAITVPVLHSTMKGPALITLTIPMGFIGFGLSAIVFGRWLSSRRIVVVVVICILSFAFSLLLRNEGMWSNGEQEFRWRWTQTEEEKLLAFKQAASPLSSSKDDEAGGRSLDDVPDWSGFRGANRDGRQRSGVKFSSDWSASPPEEIWRVTVGPGWATFAVAGGRIYTQEQRGPDEFVVCYEASSGREVWTSLAGGRFNDPMGGPGPRATPELSRGRLYGLTATGNLVCVDARTGSNFWKTDVAAIANRKPPTWGFASSPLVTDSLVIVHAGGEGDKGTLAFDTETGILKWSAPAGDHSYSSPQRSTLLGENFILMSTNKGLRLLNPETGKVRYFHESGFNSYRTLQPQRLGDDSVLMQASGGPGTYRLKLSKTGDQIEGTKQWETTWLKSEFNGCVVYDGHLYGFNGSVLVCLDIDSGERRWRGGRYGKGQMLLLEESGLLLVISERGLAALVRASPEGHEELASMQIFEGKSWSHPVVVGDRLYLRNSTEAVCYRLPAE